MKYLIWWIIYCCLMICNVSPETRPHIILIIADDMGWNDVGYHGADQIPTPNIDALAYNGIMLNKFYTLPICTPSRASLLTGQYPIRLGMQGAPISAGEDRYLPLDAPTLPEKLKDLGYSTKLVGKWHLGCSVRNATPTYRGFDYHFGYWNGFISYIEHEAFSSQTENLDYMYGLDMHENLDVNWDTRGQYATSLFTNKAQEVITNHDNNVPLFLMVSHLAPHAGKLNAGYEIPNIEENDEKFKYVVSEKRRRYVGMVDELDKSVGTIVKALADKTMLNNSIIMFMSDNGAPTIGTHENAGSNWPFRGLKFSIFEGGVRNIAIMYSAQFRNKGMVNNELIHISDLMPTLYAAAGGDVNNLGNIDGVNQWEVLNTNGKSKRSSILLNIDEIINYSALLGNEGRFKIVNGTGANPIYSEYHGEDGQDKSNPPYNIEDILNSQTNIAFGKSLTEEKILGLRQDNTIKNCRKNSSYVNCLRNEICLFDLEHDVCETTNVAEKYPEVTENLKNALADYWKEVVPQRNKKLDFNANPTKYNNTWVTWLDLDVM